MAHSWLLILISSEVEPVGGTQETSWGVERKRGDPGHDFQVVAQVSLLKKTKGTNKTNKKTGTYFFE